jgi:hypothetical protein
MAAPPTVADARALQRERFGGADGSAIFFGWLSALGLAALLLAVVAAAGTRLGFAENVTSRDVTSNSGLIGIAGAIVLAAILVISFGAGGYVAGRMARFDGPNQGLRVWLMGIIATIAAGVAAWIGGTQYNLYDQLNLPRVSIDGGDLTTGLIIAAVVALVGTLLASVAGAKAGERYHLRVDRAAWDGNGLP